MVKPAGERVDKISIEYEAVEQIGKVSNEENGANANRQVGLACEKIAGIQFHFKEIGLI